MSSSSVTLGSDGTTKGVQLEFDTLLEVCAKLSEPRPVEELLDELLRQARTMVHAEAGTVFIVDKNRLRFVCCQNDARPDLCVAPKLSERSTDKGLKTIILPMDDSSLAGYAANNGESLKIDDAYQLPPDGPYQFAKKYDESSGYRTRSLLVTPLLEPSGAAVGVLQLINHVASDGTIDEYSVRDQQIALALASMAAISVRNAKLNEELRRSYLDTIVRLSTAAEFRDDDTGEHIRRVSMYCETIARTLGYPHEFTQLILYASPMHDIGKLGVPDSILKKPGALTDEERTEMQKHTQFGGSILHGSQNELFQMAERIALAHHEKWDGTGYPQGIAGADIPIEGRITAVADVFDALTSKRVYKPAFSIEKSMGIISKDSGSHFDAKVADAFSEASEEVEAIHDAYHES